MEGEEGVRHKDRTAIHGAVNVSSSLVSSTTMKGKKALKTYSYKEFKALLGTLGFFEHHKNSTHMVFANAEHRYVTVPFSNKKEINPMMTTVTLQRIKNHQCRIL